MIIVIDLANQPCFFVRAIMSLDIGRMIGLAINRAISIGMNIAISFFKLFL